ncbi:MAG: phosphoribosyl-ATP diphosphatase [Betaproteobacteria bacterium]|nr:phosphoribosyl-ATP diphosphatase [Betaproteobacteria bacterium]
MKETLFKLEQTIASRKGAPRESSYVASLNAKGLDAILKKVGEEATEAVIAAKGGNREEIIRETADLLFHTLVMLGYQDISLAEVLAELERREGVSGLDEKKARATE